MADHEQQQRQQRTGGGGDGDDDPNNPPSSEDFSTLTLSEAYRLATSLDSSTDAPRAVALLTQLHDRVHVQSSESLFSPNDCVDDLPTSSLPLLSIEFHLSAAVLGLRTTSAEERRVNVSRSLGLYHEFMRRLDGLEGILDEALTKDYRTLMEADHEAAADDADAELNGNNSGGGQQQQLGRFRGTTGTLTAGQAREAKIARFQARKANQEEIDRLAALRERRSRIGVAPDEEMDGLDEDGIDRTVALAELRRCAADALDEVQSGVREMEMLSMAAAMEKGRADMDRHRGGGFGGGPPGASDRRGPPGRQQQQQQYPPNSRQNGRMEVTRVTQDPTTGQLQFKREQIQSQVFRPGWNQPTMTLAEYGDREIAQAQEREARQREAEEDQKGQPRRYEQIVKDGMEDDAKLVDESARLDREWDDWKDENPRGSGNKMADRGDRNF